MKAIGTDSTGSWTAILIGFPLGIIFSWTVLYISLFPMVDIGLLIIGGRLFWHPIIWAGIIPIVFMFLLWKAGDKIKMHLQRGYAVLKTSFLFTLYINSWLFALILALLIIGRLFFSPTQEPISSFSIITLTTIAITFFTYLISTVITALTIGLLVVTITKNKIYR